MDAAASEVIAQSSASSALTEPKHRYSVADEVHDLSIPSALLVSGPSLGLKF